MKRNSVKKLGVIALSVAAVMSVFSGCSKAKSNSSTSEAAKTKTDITIARAYDAAGLDPGFLKENAQIVDNIFDRLIIRDKDLKLAPGLATEWKQVDDLTWEFKLRKGVTFHNGDSFSAKDVKYSIDRVLDPKNNAPTRSYISTVSRVDIVDDYTVRVITKVPDPIIPARFNRYPTEIVPKDYVEKVGQKAFSEKPVGTGPYKFVSWAKDKEIVLEANTKYWNGEPEVKKVTWRSIPESSSRISALITGEVDIALAVPPEEVNRVKSEKAVRISTVERGGNTVFIGLKTDQAPFNNLLVRKALNYAIDVNSIVKNVLNGAATATSSLIGPKDFGYAGEPEGYEYNPQKAKELLAQAGYPNGFSATLDSVNWYIRCDDVAQAIAAQLKEVGINITVNPVESTVYRTSVPAKKQSAMYFLGWSSTNTLDADAAIYSVLHSSDNYSTYKNPKVDALLDEARSTTDTTKRAALYKEIQNIVIEDAPRIFLYQESKFIGVSNSVNFEGRIDDAIPVSTISFK